MLDIASKKLALDQVVLNSAKSGNNLTEEEEAEEEEGKKLKKRINTLIFLVTKLNKDQINAMLKFGKTKMKRKLFSPPLLPRCIPLVSTAECKRRSRKR